MFQGCNFLCRRSAGWNFLRHLLKLDRFLGFSRVRLTCHICLLVAYFLVVLHQQVRVWFLHLQNNPPAITYQ